MPTVIFRETNHESGYQDSEKQFRVTYSESYNPSTNKTTITLSKVEFLCAVNLGSVPFYGKIKIGNTVVANFLGGYTYVATVQANTWATIGYSGSYGSATVDGYGSFTMTLAAPDESHWTSGINWFAASYGGAAFGIKTNGSNASQSVTITKYALTTAVSPSGYGTVTAGDSLPQNGTKALTATPAASTAQYSYAFSSWSVSGAGAKLSSATANPTTFTMGSAAATVTANFTRAVRSYTVTCEDRVGNSSGTKLGTKTGTYEYGSSVSGASFGTSTAYDAYYTGYHYTGSSTATTVTGATVVYRYFALNTYAVSYNANGGTGAPSAQTKTYGTALTLSSTKPTRASGSAGSYTVTYNANSGSVSPTSAAAARTTAYSFSSWNTKADGSGTSYAPGGSYTANAAATLYAQWTSSTSTAAVTLPTPTRSGYAFKGWYTAASGGTRVGGGGASYTPSGNVTLYAQWDAQTSTVSVQNGNFGSAIPITISRNNSAFTHTVKVTCAGNTETLMTKGSTYPTINWTPALATYGPLIKTAMSATATVTCETYNGNTLIGTSTATCTVSFTAASVKPSTSIVATDPNGHLTTYGKFVKGKSRIRVELTNTLKYGATLKSTAITANGASYASSPAYTDLISSADNTAITARIVDSRNQSASASATIQIYDYTAPRIVSVSVYRCNSDGTANASGAYARVDYRVVITSLDNQNAKELRIKYKKITDSSYTVKTVTMSSYDQSGNVHDIVADVDSSYNIVVEVQDDFETAASALLLPTAQTHINHGTGRNGGIGIGKVAELDKTVDMASDWNTAIDGAPTGGVGYHKCADGTLIQTGRQTVNHTAVGTIHTPITFDRSFAGAPYICATINGADITVERCNCGSHSSTGFTLVTRNDYAGNNAITVDWIAIGRWK